MCYSKGNGGIGGGIGDEDWEPRYAFNASKVELFPLAVDLPLEFGRKLDGLAQELVAVESVAVYVQKVPTRNGLDAARVEHKHIRVR